MTKKLIISISQLHLATLLFGLSGVISELTSLDVILVVEARAGIAALALFVWAYIKKINLKIRQDDLVWFLLIGLLLSVHWYSFFLSIRLSGVAIGLLAFSCYPVFVIFLAPLFNESSLKLTDFGIVLVLLAGLYFILPEFSTDAEVFIGSIWGIVSGFSFALIQLINHRLVKNHNPIKISVYQNGIAALAISPFIAISTLDGIWDNLFLIFFLGFICTAFAHTIFISAMKNIRAQTVSFFIFLEPVYGIILAVLLLGQIPSIEVIAGGTLILTTIFFVTSTAKNT